MEIGVSCNRVFLYKLTPETLMRYEQNRIFFKKPRLVAYYESNYGNITKGRRIKYLTNPETVSYPMDLNAGFRTCIINAEKPTRKFEVTLKYDMECCDDEIDDVGNTGRTKVITRRGSLIDIMEIYYKKQYYDELHILVSRYNSNLYVLVEKPDFSMNKMKPADAHHAQLEKYLFSDSAKNSPELNEPIDMSKELFGIHRSSFGKYDVIYAGNIQGIMSNDEIKDFDDLEALNDCRFVFTKQMWKSLKHNDNKYLKFWLQSYLANVQNLYIGYKNSKVVTDLTKKRFWKPAICTGFLYDFLQNAEKCMSSVNCLNTVYAFCYNRIDASFSYEVYKGKSDKTFISKEYIEYCKEFK